MSATSLETLTRRERQVFELIVQGLQNKEAARVLGVSPRTVEVHRGRIARKLGVRSAVRWVRLLLEAAP